MEWLASPNWTHLDLRRQTWSAGSSNNCHFVQQNLSNIVIFNTNSCLSTGKQVSSATRKSFGTKMDLDSSQTHGVPGLMALSMVMTVLPTIAIALRIWSRLISKGQGFWWDDWFAIGSLVSNPTTATCMKCLISRSALFYCPDGINIKDDLRRSGPSPE